MLYGWSLTLGRAAAAPLVAANFLTIIPIPVPRGLAVGPMGGPMVCFPLVGAAIGAVAAGIDRLLAPWLPPSLVAALLISVMLGITGALHLDGLMDSFDGLFGGKDPAGRLAIMRDSRVGSFGIAAGVSLLLIEYGALVSLPSDGRGQALILAATLSRWAMAATLWAFPAASSSGLAAGLKPHLRGPHAAAASLAALALAAGSFGWVGVGMAAASALLVLLGGRLVVAKLGGVTGDVCGGLGQLVEATMLVVCVAVTG